MERKILFKAKRLDNGEWVEGDLLHQGLDVYIYSLDENGMLIDTEVNPSTVCQFTGLKDKNGKDVWEHDVLKHNNEIFEVVFEDGSFSIAYRGDAEPLASFSVKDGVTLMAFTNLGSKIDRKEGEK